MPVAGVVIIALNPGNLREDGCIRYVLGTVLPKRGCIVGLYVQNYYVSGPLSPHLIEQLRGIRTVGEVDFNVPIDLLLEVVCIVERNEGNQY